VPSLINVNDEVIDVNATDDLNAESPKPYIIEAELLCHIIISLDIKIY
jgi:hypothetical protein